MSKPRDGECWASADWLHGPLAEWSRNPMRMDPKNESVWIVRAQAGDARARDLLASRFARMVGTVAAREWAPGYALDDLIGWGFVGLIQCIDTFDLSKSKRLINYAVYAAWTAIRKAKRHCGPPPAAGGGDGPDRPDPAPGPAERAERAERAEAVGRALARLHWRESAALRLRYGIGDGPECTFDEIGKFLNVSKERARQILARAERHFRQMAILEGLPHGPCKGSPCVDADPARRDPGGPRDHAPARPGVGDGLSRTPSHSVSYQVR
jgi:RNA polymerase sigma factor (sigma-70 family)